MILMPYFSSNFCTLAMTTEEQSVSGMKPILTSFFSGASEPAAQAAERTQGGTSPIKPAPVVASVAVLMKSRREFSTTTFLSFTIDLPDVQKLGEKKRRRRGLPVGRHTPGHRCPVTLLRAGSPLTLPTPCLANPMPAPENCRGPCKHYAPFPYA